MFSQIFKSLNHRAKIEQQKNPVVGLGLKGLYFSGDTCIPALSRLLTIYVTSFLSIPCLSYSEHWFQKTSQNGSFHSIYKMSIISYMAMTFKIIAMFTISMGALALKVTLHIWMDVNPCSTSDRWLNTVGKN